MDAGERFSENEKLAYYIVKKCFPGRRRDEDIKQTALLGLWKACVNYDESKGVPFGAYAQYVIRREIISELRIEAPGEVRWLDTLEDSGVGWIDRVGFLEHLTDKQRRVVLLIEAGYSREEVAGELGVTCSAIGAMLKRARRVFDEYV